MTDILTPARVVSWFSCGAASAVATKLSSPDVIAYCETGSEDPDNARFMRDCEKWFGIEITELRSEKYASTWEVWEDKQYISGIAGAPCTGALKVAPRLAFQKEGDLHIFGYTADSNDMRRAKALQENYPDIMCSFPLIEKGITKAACIQMVENAGIKPPIVYSKGLPNANCIPCCKAQSPAYWATIRHHYPKEFARMAELSRRVGTDGARLAVIKGERVFIDEIPLDQDMSEPIAPECDFLCSLAEEDFG